MKLSPKICLAIACATIPSAAYAQGGDEAGFRLSATVPVVCQLEASALVVGKDANEGSASVFEMCNSSGGFRVLAYYRALEPGEQVQIDYAGQLRQLDPGGMSEVASRPGPKVGSVPVFVQTHGLVEGLAISLGMVAI